MLELREPDQTYSIFIHKTFFLSFWVKNVSSRNQHDHIGFFFKMRPISFKCSSFSLLKAIAISFPFFLLRGWKRRLQATTFAISKLKERLINGVQKRNVLYWKINTLKVNQILFSILRAPIIIFSPTVRHCHLFIHNHSH